MKKMTVVIGVCGGIAGYKVVKLIKSLRKKGAEVIVVMTKTSQLLFSKVMFEKASGQKVYSSLVEADFNYREVLEKREVEHIKLADLADLLIIVPATANIIGKVASGIADDLLSTIIMAAKAPALFCPSMNVHMWENPILQKNISKLRAVGYHFIAPDKGDLACGYKGVGRLAELKTIENKVFRMLENKNKLKNLKILVTAGGTTEAIDQVRVLTNRSSGKMGIAIACECFFQGAQVRLLKAESSNVAQYEVGEERFTSVKDLEEKIKKNITKFDVIFHTAAVSDYTLDKIFPGKYKSDNYLNLKLKTVPKIIDNIKKWNPKIILIGFKAVYKKTEKEMIKIGKEKLKVSNADYIVVNDIGRSDIGFASDDNEVIIISKNGFLKRIKKAKKEVIARGIIEILSTNIISK